MSSDDDFASSDKPSKKPKSVAPQQKPTSAAPQQMKAGSGHFATRLLELVFGYPMDFERVWKTLRDESTTSTGNGKPDQPYIQRQVSYMKFDGLIPIATYPHIPSKKRQGYFAAYPYIK